ncbi:MAG: DUF6569 family protein [archaeon]
MKALQDYIQGLVVGNVQQYKNLALAPLYGKDSSLEYLVLDEAFKQGLSIRETGTVQRLYVENNTGRDVLILQGEYVTGGKQNRMVSLTAYLDKNFRGEIPVNCIEQHRWSSSPKTFEPITRMAPLEVSYAASHGQNAVWGMVGLMASEHHVHSPTANLGDVFTAKQSDINDYRNKFSYTPGTVGVVFQYKRNGRITYGCELFDKTATMEKQFTKVLERYAVNALHGAGDLAPEDAGVFLSRLQQAAFQNVPAISLGQNFTISGSVQGHALVHQGKPVYVSFGDTNGGGKPEQIPDWHPPPLIPEPWPPWGEPFRHEPWRKDPNPRSPYRRDWFPSWHGPIYGGTTESDLCLRINCLSDSVTGPDGKKLEDPKIGKIKFDDV